MPPKSNGGRSKFVPKPKQEWQVKQPTRNWLDLPSDLMRNILERVGVVDCLENAELVCTAWHEICKDPAMWRVVYMDMHYGGRIKRLRCREMCKRAVDRSQGQLLDLTITGFCDGYLFQYVVDRSSQLRRLELVQYVHDIYFHEIWTEAFKKLPLLEELSLLHTKFFIEDIEAAGRFCPLLKTLKLNRRAHVLWDGYVVNYVHIQNNSAVSIAKNLPKLTHLELIGNRMTNIGLQVILDGCCHLESLDLRRCENLDLEGDLGKRCSKQIKSLKLPRDSLEGCPYNHILDDLSWR